MTNEELQREMEIVSYKLILLADECNEAQLLVLSSIMNEYESALYMMLGIRQDHDRKRVRSLATQENANLRSEIIDRLIEILDKTDWLEKLQQVIRIRHEEAQEILLASLQFDGDPN